MLTTQQLVARVSPALGVVNSSAGRGTVFVVDKQGLLLTSSYLVRGLDTVQVQLPAQPEMTGTVIGRDEFSGLALLRVTPPADLPTLTLATVERAALGADVAAFGHSQGATAGTPSTARGTIVSVGQTGGVQYIQTDANFEAGFYGGPLVAYNGDVVGLSTPRIEPASGQVVQSIGMAVHVTTLRDKLTRLTRGAQYFRPTKLEDFYPAGTTPPVPPFPNIFRGTATIDGQPVTDNAQVYARIGRYVSNPVVAKGGSYPYLTVQPPAEEGFAGKEIVFYVDGFPATQRPVYQANLADPLVDLNLVATSQP